MPRVVEVVVCQRMRLQFPLLILMNELGVQLVFEACLGDGGEVLILDGDWLLYGVLGVHLKLSRRVLVV